MLPMIDNFATLVASRVYDKIEFPGKKWSTGVGERLEDSSFLEQQAQLWSMSAKVAEAQKDAEEAVDDVLLQVVIFAGP